MKIEETLDILKQSFNIGFDYGTADITAVTVYKEHAETVIEALEKQIKKPLKRKYTNGTGMCNECGQVVKLCDRFCSYCGQALKWGGAK